MTRPSTSQATLLGTVGELWRYPVKSMQGEHVDSVVLDALGIVGDRHYALRDLTSGTIISAKVPSLGRPLLTCNATTTESTINVTVNGTSYDVDQQRDMLDAALTDLLGRPVRVEAVSDDPETYHSEWPALDDMALPDVTVELPLHHGTFADLAPLHLLTTTSLDHLRHLDASLDIAVQRFRPGIVIDRRDIDDVTSFVENEWEGRRVRIGDAEITFGPAAPRCIMTTLEQPGHDADKAILTTIAEHNRRDYAGFGHFACLGVYADIDVAGTISVGDRIEIVA